MKKILFSFFIVLATVMACQSQQTGYTLDAKSFADKIKQTPQGIILDVRTAGEVAEGFIEGAINLDFNGGNFEAEVEKLDKSKTYFVYCLAGGRSSSAANYMRSNGFKNVFDLKGGINAWRNNDLPLTKSVSTVKADKISMQEHNQMIASGVVLIDYYAPWCAPCRKMEPTFTELTKQYEGKIKVIRLNIDENKNLAKQLKVE